MVSPVDRKSTRLNSSHSLHNALPISPIQLKYQHSVIPSHGRGHRFEPCIAHHSVRLRAYGFPGRSEEHTSELQSLPAQRSSDLTYPIEISALGNPFTREGSQVRTLYRPPFGPLEGVWFPR